jgi:hypothetical protein
LIYNSAKNIMRLLPFSFQKFLYIRFRLPYNLVWEISYDKNNDDILFCSYLHYI